MREIVDLGEIIENGFVRHHDRQTGDSVKTASDTSFVELCNTLLYELEKDEGIVDNTQFVVHPHTYNDALQNEDLLQYSTPGQDRIHGKPIKTHHTMPEDTILCFSPNALTFGGKVVNPWMIAVGDLEINAG